MARQIKRLLQSELKHVSEWTYVLILAIYACMVILQLNSFPMWFCSLREGSFLGFFPDPTLKLSAEDALLFGNAEVFRGLLFNVAPLAHALFFPFIAACIVPRFVSSGFVEEPWGLSEARGGKRVCAIVARVVLSSFALLGAFVLSSVVLYCLNCAIVSDAQQYFNLHVFCYRLVLAAAACLAYVVSCVIVVSYFGSGFGRSDWHAVACQRRSDLHTDRGQFHASASSLDAHVDLRRDPVGEWSMHLDFN